MILKINMGTFLHSLIWCFVVLLLYFEENRIGGEGECHIITIFLLIVS